MDGKRFDDLTRTLARQGSRRQALRAIMGAAGLGAGIFGRGFSSTAFSQTGSLDGQANQDAGYKALRQYLQKSGFQPQGPAETTEVIEDGTWVASALGRTYGARSGIVGTLAYVVHGSGTSALAVLESGGMPYTILSAGADGGVYETPVPEPTALSGGESLRNLAPKSRLLATGGQSFVTSDQRVQSFAAAQPSGACLVCEETCGYALGQLADLACKFGPGLLGKLKAIASLAARCAAGGTVAAVCIAVYYGLCKLGGLDYLLSIGCGPSCGRLGCAGTQPQPSPTPPPPPGPTECGACQVLVDGSCVPRTDCSNGCNPDTGECYPPPDPECTSDFDCLDCQTCNQDTGLCEGTCLPPPDPDEPCTADSDCPGCQICDAGDGVCLDFDGLCTEPCQSCVGGICTDCPMGCKEDTGECFTCGACQVLENGTCIDCPNGCDAETGECYQSGCGWCQMVEADYCIDCPNGCDPNTGKCYHLGCTEDRGCYHQCGGRDDSCVCVPQNPIYIDGIYVSSEWACAKSDSIRCDEVFVNECDSHGDCPAGSFCYNQGDWPYQASCSNRPCQRVCVEYCSSGCSPSGVCG